MKIMMSGRIVFMLCWLFLSALSDGAYSQQSGSSGGNTNNNSGTNTATPLPKDVPILIPITPTVSFPPREIQPIFVSGNVMQEDGSPPPYGAIIEMDCGGTKTREAIVTPNGRFSFQYGGSRKLSDLVPDASDSTAHINDEAAIYWSPISSGSGSKIETTTPLNIRLSGCDLRAQLPGYRSSAIRLNGATLTSVNEAGGIVIYPVDRARGTSVSAANLLAPPKAKSLLKQAAKAYKKEKYDDTERLMKSAIEIYPNYVDAWVQLGKLYQQQHRFKEAQEALKKAEETDPLFVIPHVQMCWVFANEQRWLELAEKSENALTLDPVAYPELYYLSALAQYNLRHFEGAEKRARQAKLRDTFHQYPSIHLILANIFELKNNMAGLKEELRNYLSEAPNASDVSLVRKRLKGITEKAALESGTH